MTQAEQEHELNILDFWATIKRHKRIIVITPTVCGIAAYILAAFIIAPKWEASAVLQIGQVGQVGQVGSKLVEPVNNVVARMQHPSFAEEVLKRANFKSEDLAAVKPLYDNSLKVTRIKDADLVEFKLRGYSPDMARTLASCTISYLQKAHDEMMAATVVRINAQIQNVSEEIHALHTDLDFLKKQLQGKHDWNSYNATLAATVLQDKANQLRELTQKRLMLNEQMSPSVTFTTKVLGDVNVSEEPVSPKKPVIIGLAIVLGLLGGIFMALVRNSVSKGKV